MTKKSKALKDEKMRLLTQISETDPTSEKYNVLAERLHQLEDLHDRKFSWDTVIHAGAYLLGIGFIIAYEQKHVFASKAQNYLPKLK